MKTKKSLYLLTLLIIILFAFPGVVQADDDKPTVPRPMEIPEHILKPWTLLGDSLDTSWDSTEGEGDLVTPRIVGGAPVSPQNAFPFMATYTFFDEPWCGGTLIEANWVLTAAHCWADASGNPYAVDPENDKVILGEYSLSTTSGHEQVIPIEAVYLHPNYDPNVTAFLQYDVALIKLQSPAELNQYVNIINIGIDIPRFTTGLYGWQVTTLGWGNTSYGGTPSDVLRYVNITYLPPSKCSNYGPSFDAATMACAGIYTGGKDACQGDSGGPLIFNFNGEWIQIGVTSWGYECARPGFPGVYAKVFIPVVYNWINSIMSLTPSNVTGIIPTNGQVVVNTAPMSLWNPSPEKPFLYDIIILKPDNSVFAHYAILRTWLCNTDNTFCRWSMTPELPEGIGYSYFLRTYKVGYGWSSWSTVDFDIDPYLAHISPADGTELTTLTPTFTWSDSTLWDPTQFKLQVSVSDGGTPIVNTYTINATSCSGGQCSYQPTLPISSGTYTWQIRAYKPTIGWTSYSDPWGGTIAVGP